MATVRLQSRYWGLIHHANELAMKDLERKIKRLRQKLGRREHYLVHECLKFENQLGEAMMELERYQAIDEIIMRAMQKGDGPFTSPLGPDVPVPEELTPEEEFKLRIIDSID